MAAPLRVPNAIHIATPSSRYNPNPSRFYNPLTLQRSSSIDAGLFSRRPDQVSSIASAGLPNGLLFTATATLESQRRVSPRASVFGEDAPQKFTPFLWNIILDVLGFIWRLPSTLMGFFRKKESVITEVEEDVNKAADVAKLAAKAIEEAAEDVEKVAMVTEQDAERVEALLDKVKVKTKIMHEEMDEALGTLEGSVEEVAKSASQKTSGKVEVTVEEEITETKMRSPSPPADSPATNTSNYKSSNSMGGLPQWNPWTGIAQMLQASSFNKRAWTVLRAFLAVLVQIHMSKGLVNPQLVDRVMSSALVILT